VEEKEKEKVWHKKERGFMFRRREGILTYHCYSLKGGARKEGDSHKERLQKKECSQDSGKSYDRCAWRGGLNIIGTFKEDFNRGRHYIGRWRAQSRSEKGLRILI